MKHICEQCQKDFSAPPSQGARFCSRNCYDESRKGSFICKNCGETFGDYKCRDRVFCSDDCQRKFAKGSNHYHWKGGKRLQSGYYVVYCPTHPSAHNGVVREHRLIMEQQIGRYLDGSELVHHINGNKLDNRIENLEIIDRPSHASKHHPANK